MYIPGEIPCMSVFSISKMRMTVTSRSLMTGRPIMQTCLEARRVEHAWTKERERAGEGIKHRPRIDQDAEIGDI